LLLLYLVLGPVDCFDVNSFLYHLPQRAETHTHIHISGWARKSKPAYFCNNFVYCQPICI